jgi:hypothetical protein
MPRETFFKRTIQTPEGPITIEAAINFDDAAFGKAIQAVTPWTIAVTDGHKDVGRVVGFEGEGQLVLGMHPLKPDPSAQRAVDITVFRISDAMHSSRIDEAMFGAFERWLLKRGWRGNLVKNLYFTAAETVVPIRRFWIGLGFELVLSEQGKWGEHVVKRWR